MRLHPCHKGHRFRLPHWPAEAYVDILYVGRAHIVTKDEFGKEVMIDRDDMLVDWIHLGATPSATVDRRKKSR